MSIYLAHNSKMLKADSARPGRYFGWIDNTGDLSGLLYLTYFTTDFMTDSTKYDTPVVRDQSIPLIQGASNAYLGNSNKIYLENSTEIKNIEIYKTSDRSKVWVNP